MQLKTRMPSVSTGDLEAALAKVVEDYEERLAQLGQQHESDLNMKEFVMDDQHKMEISVCISKTCNPTHVFDNKCF